MKTYKSLNYKKKKEINKTILKKRIHRIIYKTFLLRILILFFNLIMLIFSLIVVFYFFDNCMSNIKKNFLIATSLFQMLLSFIEINLIKIIKFKKFLITEHFLQNSLILNQRKKNIDEDKINCEYNVHLLKNEKNFTYDISIKISISDVINFLEKKYKIYDLISSFSKM